MKTQVLGIAAIGLGVALALSSAPVLGQESVDDMAFDDQTQAVGEKLQLQEEAGVFGRAGSIPGEEALPAGTVRDRDFDRYVERLGWELRMRNMHEERDPSGFH